MSPQLLFVCCAVLCQKQESKKQESKKQESKSKNQKQQRTHSGRNEKRKLWYPVLCTRTANSRINPRRIALSPTRAGQQKLRNQISALRRLWQIYLGLPNFANQLTGTRTPNRCLPFQVHCSSKMVVPAICVVPAIPAPPPEMSFFFSASSPVSPSAVPVGRIGCELTCVSLWLDLVVGFACFILMFVLRLLTCSPNRFGDNVTCSRDPSAGVPNGCPPESFCGNNDYVGFLVNNETRHTEGANNQISE